MGFTSVNIIVILTAFLAEIESSNTPKFFSLSSLGMPLKVLATLLFLFIFSLIPHVLLCDIIPLICTLKSCYSSVSFIWQSIFVTILLIAFTMTALHFCICINICCTITFCNLISYFYLLISKKRYYKDVIGWSYFPLIIDPQTSFFREDVCND